MNRTSSLNRPPKNLSRRNSAVRSARGSAVNRMRSASRGVGSAVNRMRSASRGVGSAVNRMRSASRGVGSVVNRMRSASRGVGSAINSLRLTSGAKRRHRNRRDRERRDILESEIKTMIEEKSSQELKEELLRNLDEKLKFKTHSEEGYHTYYTCDKTKENETLLDDYIFVIGQLYFSYSGTIQQILKEVRREAEIRTNYCYRIESRHTHY